MEIDPNLRVLLTTFRKKAFSTIMHRYTHINTHMHAISFGEFSA